MKRLAPLYSARPILYLPDSKGPAIPIL